ncbi:hypothetical protein [Pseudomonas sp. SJZ131]|uniref:hypothetical protein n=1 Tax=Pseudomonas sp. SJZ131 TaxID=2572895 RepID=UPI0021146473|nr:hypothetical protein [Pseudomonas sp. SJZ131]
MNLSLRRVNSSNGERLIVLVDELGMPLFYPALYVTVHMRGRSLALNTIQSALSALKAMYAWQRYYNIDVESRFSSGELLLSHEIHSLRDFMQKPLADEDRGSGILISRTVRTVSKGNQYTRMSVIADYLGFLADQNLPTSVPSHDGIGRMVSQIKANRPKTSGLSASGEDAGAGLPADT